MPWCHTCRVEYPRSQPACPECRGILSNARPPERRLSAASGGTGLVVLATLPPEEALVASERLEEGGVPNSLRDAGGSPDPTAVDVMVSPSLVARAQAVLRGRRPRSTLGMYLFIATAIGVFLSGSVIAIRWLMTGSPLP